MRRILLLAVAFTALGSAASATTCKLLDWKMRPTQSQLFGVWPREAFQKGQNGRAKLQCKVSVQGALHDCTVLAEDPPNAGFGQAALALTPQFLMTPTVCDGKPVEEDVRIPINFTGLTPHDSPGAGIWSRLPPRPSKGPLVIAHVPWIAAPTYAQVVAAYPDKARADHQGGHVALNCTFGGDGRLAHCDVLSEVPAGQGFAASARALSKDFVGPRTRPDGAVWQNDTTTVAVTFDPAMLNGQTPIIGEPKWTHLPEAVDVAASFPAAAKAAHVATGHVTMTCDVGVGGRLTGCAVTRAAPEGLGFEEAAVALSANFQVTMWTDEGLPTVGGRLTVPIRYEAGTAEDSAHPAPFPPPPPPAIAQADGSPVAATQGPAPRLPGRDVAFAEFDLFTNYSAGPYYPQQAMRQEITGSAQLDCAVGDKGALDGCVVTAEAPEGMGFGKAAEAMARRRAIRLKAAAGAQRAGNRVRVSVPFTIGQSTPR